MAKNKKLISGFTIVELLIVIVIIGILAAITIVSYTGIAKRAIEATLKSDLANASKKLQLYYADHGIYPQDLDVNGCPTIPLDDNYCIKSSSNNILDYIATAPYSDYTLTAEKGDSKYKILGSNTVPVKMNTIPITAITDITGIVKEGQVLTAGSIAPGAATVAYQWQIATTSGGTYTDISGATDNTYLPISSDVGKYLKVQVTGTGDYRDTIISSATTVVAAATTPITGIAAITGTAQIGQTLTSGTLTPATATATYQWQKAITETGTYANISGATNNTYTPNLSDAGKYLKVIATATGDYIGTQTSTASSQIAADSNWKIMGTQVWASANLNVGTRINGASSQTNNAMSEKYCYNDNESNCTIYGGLYQWDELMQYTTIARAKGLCPTYSHVPTDNEWKTLEMFLGMTQAQADAGGWRSSDVGNKLKPGGASGLNMPLTGYRNTDGTFTNIGEGGSMWSSSAPSNYAWYRGLNSTDGTVSRDTAGLTYGFPVRCLVD